MFGRPRSSTTTRTAHLQIDGMHCTSCSLTIDDSLEELTGVVRSSTNYAKSAAVVEYDPALIGTEAILEAVRAVGYGASLAA